MSGSGLKMTSFEWLWPENDRIEWLWPENDFKSLHLIGSGLKMTALSGSGLKMTSFEWLWPENDFI